MSQLVVLSDPIKQERRHYELRPGETLAIALMRLWPSGLNGSWRIYRDLVSESSEIAAVDLPYVVVLNDENYMIVRDMAGPVAAAFGGQVAFQAFLVNVFSAIAFQLAIAALTPKPPRFRPEDPDNVSPNNLIAGQSNQLRPGARVPELLGRVRAYPDLLCAPVDVYNEADQTIAQMFVLGMGSYDEAEIRATAKLGETPIPNVATADLDVYQPGQLVPPFYVMKVSREVGDVSLMAEDTGAHAVTGDTDFIASSKEMHTLEPVAVGTGRPIIISTTLFNNGAFFVDSVPPNSQTTPPFVYVLDGPVANENDAEASIAFPTEALQISKPFSFGNSVPFSWEPEDIPEPPPVPPKQQQVQFPYGWPGKDKIPKVGQLIELQVSAGPRFRGRISSTRWPIGGRALYWGITMNDLNGNPIVFPSLSKKATNYHTWDQTGSTGGTAPPTPGGITNAATPWYAAPMTNPQEIWVDIAFPSGLAYYDRGGRRSLKVEIRVEFRRKSTIDAPPQAHQDIPFFYGTATPMRFTKRFDVSLLGLPAEGSDVIEVRLQRISPFYSDTDNNSYVQDSRWIRLAAVRQLVQQTYEKATVLAFSISNTRSAGAVGDMALNVMATRILPTWDPVTGWSEPAPTTRWADNFVARCKAEDGASRTDAQIDLAGIYQLQAHLDTLDRPSEDPTLPGMQGQISMTLDQMQDIDSELAQIADVVRAIVYRVGRKLFAVRDQANATTIALFNARTKGPEGESVSIRMTGDADNDCVVVPWIDAQLGWKMRDYRFPEDSLALNPMRVGAQCANWEQVRRRAVFEWNKLKYRREALTVTVTEDGRICRPGDVINVTDDIATLALCAGEVITVDGAELTLDRDLILGEGSSFVILLRDAAGVKLDLVPCTPTSGFQNRVTLARAPRVTIKGRDACLGSMFVFYPADTSPVRPWLVTGIETAGPYVTIAGINYTEKAYLGDSDAMPARPPPPNLS